MAGASAGGRPLAGRWDAQPACDHHSAWHGAASRHSTASLIGTLNVPAAPYDHWMGEDATVQPETIRATSNVPGPSIAVRPHLWYTWAMIAIREEQRGWLLRRKGRQERDFAPYLVQEAQEAMQAVVAARHALHNLFRVWKPMLSLSGERKIRPLHFTTASLQPGWQERVLRLIDDRDGVVHHDEQTAPARPHPEYPTNVSALEAAFTAERASEAVDVVLNDVLRPAILAPSTRLDAWASPIVHALVDLDTRRASGDDVLV